MLDGARLLAPISRYPHVSIALSGGADSTALVLLAARSGLPATRFTALIVDHQLRPESAAEAEAARQVSENIGVPARVLVWKGEKPNTGLQAAAREARYKILTEAARAEGAHALMTAHTLDDVAETFLMRLARGSGLDGLAGIPAQTMLYGMNIHRPLLAVSHAELVETLEREKISWCEDPSNRSQAFERARLRAAMASHLAKLGLSAGKIGLSAARLARARDVLEKLTTRFIEENTKSVQQHAINAPETHVGHDAFAREPAEIQIRVMAQLLPGAELAQVEKLCEWLTQGQEGQVTTLGGQRVEVADGQIRLRPEGPRGKG